MKHRQYARHTSPTNTSRDLNLLTTKPQLRISIPEKKCLNLINWKESVAKSIIAENRIPYPNRIVFYRYTTAVFCKKILIKSNWYNVESKISLCANWILYTRNEQSIMWARQTWIVTSNPEVLTFLSPSIKQHELAKAPTKLFCR